MTPSILGLLTIQLTLAAMSLDAMQAQAAVMSAADYKTYAVAMAEKYGIDEEQFVGTLQCESNWQPQKQSDFYKNGKREESYGIAQINLPAHLDVTYDEATDGTWSIEWAAQKFQAGNKKWWTCWRNKYGYDST